MANQKSQLKLAFIWTAIIMSFGFSFLSIYFLDRLEIRVCEYTYQDILDGKDGSIKVGIEKMEKNQQRLDSCAKWITLEELYDDYRLYVVEQKEKRGYMNDRLNNRTDEIKELKEFLGIVEFGHPALGYELTDNSDKVYFVNVCDDSRGWEEIQKGLAGGHDWTSMTEDEIQKCVDAERKIFND